MKKLILIILISTLTSCTGYNFYDLLNSLGDTSPHLARSISFADTDYMPDSITGTLKFSPALSESNITEYRLYWGNGPSTKNSSTIISTFAPNGSDQTFPFTNEPVPAGATHFLIYSVKGTDEMSMPASFDIPDLVVEPLGAACTNPAGFAIIDNILYFGADSGNGIELHKSDGTSAGTSAVANLIDLFPGGDGLTLFSWIAGLNGKLIFSAQPSFNNLELWIYDPLSIPLGPLYTFSTNPALIEINGPAASDPSKPVLLNGEFYFAATNSVTGRELWVFDPSLPNHDPGPPLFLPYTTTTNPKLIDINTGIAPSSPNNLTVYNGKLYFSASNGIGVNGMELWEFTPGSPIVVGINPLLIDINPGPGDSNPLFLTVYNGKLYFSANNGINGFELMSYDGTSVQLIKDINPVGDSSPIGLTVFNNKFVFAATEPIHGRELWISDGTLSGTYIIKDQNPGAGNSTMGIPFVYKNKLYMSLIVDPLNGNQFGVSNGTNSGTAQIMIGTAGASYPSNPQYFASLNGMVYFVADKGLGDGLQIFRTDGTFSGTVQLTAGLLNNNPLNKPKELIEYKGRIYFKGTDFAVTKTEVYVLYYK